MKNNSNRLAVKMLIAMVAGIAFGIVFMLLREHLGATSAAWTTINNLLFQDITAKGAESAVGLFYIGGQLFIRSLQLVIVPMVFSSVVMAICEVNEARTLGRIAGKTMGWFMMTTTIALTLAGAVALYHVAAAAARAGKSLDEVAAIAQKYADNMASITVKSTDATHPQNGASFGDLGETDLMEVGAGQHGEGGGIRMPMMSSKETVALVAEPLCKKLGLTAGDKAFVMINGCGATTMMEMLVLFKDTVEFLQAKGVEVVGNMVGEILTVQEAAGFQMNIAKWDDETLELWNTPCHTPAYSKE